MKLTTEKRWLQCAVALACIVPLSAGLGGMLFGIDMLGRGNINIDSHFRYLSGLLLGIGIYFASSIPHIERYNVRFRTLTFIVMIGGIGRLLGIILEGLPAHGMQAALIMELVVTPALCLWQNSVAKRYL